MRTVRPVAHIYNDFTEKFGIPRQSGLVPEIISRIVPEKEFASPDAFRGIEEFSHLWLLWDFSENGSENKALTVRPPRLGGNTRVGVFATRSPFRPNGIGLSSVKLEKVITDKPELLVSGADLLSGTPIYDIKPYIPYTDSHPDARGGFSDKVMGYHLKVIFETGTEAVLGSKAETVKKILEQDPRPSYHTDETRLYSVAFGGFDIKFTVSKGILTVKEIISVANNRDI